MDNVYADSHLVGSSWTVVDDFHREDRALPGLEAVDAYSVYVKAGAGRQDELPFRRIGLPSSSSEGLISEVSSQGGEEGQNPLSQRPRPKRNIPVSLRLIGGGLFLLLGCWLAKCSDSPNARRSGWGEVLLGIASVLSLTLGGAFLIVGS